MARPWTADQAKTSAHGRRVAGIKITGTGACGDYWEMADAGAAWVGDFVDAGFVSTYRIPAESLETILRTLAGPRVYRGLRPVQ